MLIVEVLFRLIIAGLMTVAIAGWKHGGSGGGGGGGGNQYYVAAGGSDGNNGTSTSTPWQTISHVNSELGSIPSGATVAFNGGDTFSGNLVLAQPVTINSYGTGQAIISSGNSASCVSMTNISNVTVNNINCTGGGNTSNTTYGIEIYNTSSSQLTGPTITNNTVSGYGNSGIWMQQSNTGGSFINTLISGNTVHDVTGNYTGGDGSSCIQITNPAWTNPLVVGYYNGTVEGNLVYNCTGASGASNWTGSGIAVFGASNFTVQFNVAHNNGGTGFGATGIWTAVSTGITIQYNESYDTATTGSDGDGYDMDGDTTNSFTQYNYSHNNYGDGYLLWTGTFGAGGHNNNTVRFNISENDGTGGANGSGGFVTQKNGPATDYVYNNTFYSTQAYCGYVGGNATFFIANNIFYCTNQFGTVSAGNAIWNGNDFYGGVSTVGSNALTSDPGFTSPGGGGTCYSSGTPAGPQPCPSAYQSTLTTGGQNLNSLYGINVGSTDYYGNSITSSTLPIGAYK